ncbi:hypothetical protein D9M71_559140 [compost metagenome]
MLLLQFDLLRAQVEGCQYQQLVTDQGRVLTLGIGQRGVEHLHRLRQRLLLAFGGLDRIIAAEDRHDIDRLR